MKRTTTRSKPDANQLTGPLVPGSPLFHLLERVARAVAKRLLEQSEPTEGSPPKSQLNDLTSTADK